MVARWPHSFEEVVCKRRWLASRGSGRCVLLLTANGGGLVDVVVTVFHSRVSKSKVAVLVVRLWSHVVAPFTFAFFGVPAALAVMNAKMIIRR
ncbi:hypothetical protein Taro_049209 [Colocasia esculenta]|uniref:Uncharacterized protein n=1 Tax=Colocasia esculenta TaxID=4460 RepID=A0A843XAB0_COLES|nr:hypothetical protein [Colocasia esculenta]